ncbi:hypothetical protein BGW38_004785, partial [Lunasporangiospora selenospora]
STATGEAVTKSLSVASASAATPASVQAHGSLAPPKDQPHLKTHFRTHSRNGSTVTVQDLKQAIAAASTENMDLPPLSVLASSPSSSSTLRTTDAPATVTATTTDSSMNASDPATSPTSLQNPPVPMTTATATATATTTVAVLTTTMTTSISSMTTTATIASLPKLSIGSSIAVDPSSLPSPMLADGKDVFGVSLLPPLSPLSSSPSSSTGSSPPSSTSSTKRYSTPDFSAFSNNGNGISSGSTPSLSSLRDSHSHSLPLASPSISSRPSSMILGRSARDRNVSVPPFFAYSIPHEFPSPYTSPRLKLPGADGPTSLPASPFARKRKHAYCTPTLHHPSSTFTIKLSGQDESVACAHPLSVGDTPDIPFVDYEFDPEACIDTSSIDITSLNHNSNNSALTNDLSVLQDQNQDQDKNQNQDHSDTPVLVEPITEPHNSTLPTVSALGFANTLPADKKTAPVVDKRLSWASMVSMDEDQAKGNLPASVAAAAPIATSQPYRPPASRLRAAGESKASPSAGATNGTPAMHSQQQRKQTGDSTRPVRRSSPTQAGEDLATLLPAEQYSRSPSPSTKTSSDSSDFSSSQSAEPVSKPTNSPSTSRIRKAAPPPLNLVGSNTAESTQQAAAGSPTTPTTPSRRRRSRSRKNCKDKNAEGGAAQTEKDKERESTEAAEENGNGDGEIKKNRTRSRSRSRSRNRARAESVSNGTVPPVPQTPSWVTSHIIPPPQAGGTAPLSPLTASRPQSVTPEPPATASGRTTPAMTINTSIITNSNPNNSTTTTAVANTNNNNNNNNSAAGALTDQSDLKRRGPRPARLLSTRSSHNLHLQTVNENSAAAFSPRSARDAPPSDYFSMRPLQHSQRTPMTPMTPGGGEYGDDDDDYYNRLQMVTTPMIQNGFFPNWAKGDAQLEELERIRLFLNARQYPDEMPLSDEWTLFFSDTSRAKDKNGVQDAYSSAITPLFSCHTVPQFATSWKYVRERVRPATMKVNQNLHWFKKGIKPMWEDPKNKYGGRLTLCPPRALLDIVWETVLILMAGDVLDLNGEGTGAVFARRARGDRVEVWLGSDDSPEALAHIRGVLIQELTASGADELVRAAKYKKHFDSRKEEKQKAKDAAAAAAVAAGTSGATGADAAAGSGVPSTPQALAEGPLSASANTKEIGTVASQITATSSVSSPHLPPTPRMGNGPLTPSGLGPSSDYQSFEAFAQQQQLLRERERERERESLLSPLALSREQERIMQLGKERLEKERAERLEKERAERERTREERVRALAAAAMAASEAKHQQQLKERELQQQRQ